MLIRKQNKTKPKLNMAFPQNPTETDTVTVPILQRKKLRHRRLKSLVRHHKAQSD